MSTKNKIKYSSLIIIIISFLLFKFHFDFTLIKTILIILFIIAVFILFILYQLRKRLKGAGYSEEWHDLYGDKILNIPYFNENNQIINSFKKGGINYKYEIGEINEGKNYDKNNRNYYDLFIPYTITKRKNTFNGIFLFIHGGGWHKGKKENISFLTKRYAKYGYITAQMNHSFLDKENKQNTIFRILDEITSCLENIKYQLKKMSFDENKLELAIGGASSGAHLSLLYGYSMKNSPFPIKFLINYCGPLSFESKYWYKLGKNIPAFDNIEDIDIDNVIKDNKIVKMFGNEKLLEFMNRFIGYKYNDNELKEMMIREKINLENEKFKELNKIVKYCFPTNFINENSVPTLCFYGGMDSAVGILQYFHLKKLFEKYQNKIELVYMKNGGHLLDDYKSKEGMNAIREIHFKILNFAKNYFTKEN